jgi:hypothetical protein
MNESHQRKEPDRKKVTVRLSKPVRFLYRPEYRRLIPVPVNPDNEYSVTVEMVLPYVDLSEELFVQNLMRKFRPDTIADRMQNLMEQNIERDFQKALDRAEYDVVRQSASRVIASDDEPGRIYRFLADVLKTASVRMETESKDFAHELTIALQNRGLIQHDP